MRRPRLLMFQFCTVPAIVAQAAIAAPFSSAQHLVVIRCTDGFGAEMVYLDEYDVSGETPTLLQTIPIPADGPDAISLPGLTNHDRHLHRSPDGRTLAFVAYNTPYDPSFEADPSAFGAADIPRVVALVGQNGSVDLSTRLTSAFDYTAVRGAVSTDGNKIWVAGDNASGATATGGTRFTTRGSSASVNLSQVQGPGTPHTPDNIRDISIFAGQLYDCSGSSSSVGKALFQVGNGLPESGSQTLTTLTTDNASVSSFYFLDADASVPGLDTVYTATSAGNTLRKYNLVAGSWVSRGLIVGFSDIEHVVALPIAGGQAIVYAWHNGGICRFVDPLPYGNTLAGNFPDPYITAPSGFTLGGFDFAPGCASNGDMNNDGVFNSADFSPFVQAVANPSGYQLAFPGVPLLRGDMNCDGQLNGLDAQAIIDALLGS